MRLLSVTQIKRRKNGQKLQELQLEPREGTRTREIYDALLAAPGRPVDLSLSKMTNGRHDHGPLVSLKLFYGLDIRLVRHGRKSAGRNALHALVGEWFGKIYVDYTCETEEQMELLLKARDVLVTADHTDNLLPDGVHRVSKQDMETLRRIAEKGEAALAKHMKRES